MGSVQHRQYINKKKKKLQFLRIWCSVMSYLNYNGGGLHSGEVKFQFKENCTQDKNKQISNIFFLFFLRGFQEAPRA